MRAMKSSLAGEEARNDFPILKTLMNGKPLVYLDNAASTQKPKQVIDALTHYYEAEHANIHRGVYQLSEEATRLYEEAHAVVAQFINALPEEIVFTRNTTESLNLLAYSLCSELKEGDEIVLTQMEHHSNLVPWQQMAKKKNLRVVFAPITVADGTLNMNEFKKLVTSRTKIVSVTHVSNFLGTINPVEEISRIAHSAGAVFVVDGAQSVPHMPVDVKKMGCDFLAFSGHKMVGPTGIGVLFGRKELLERMEPFLYGGDMIKEVTFEGSKWNDVPWKFEAGTPSIADGIALARAVEYLQEIGMANIMHGEKELVRYALECLKNVPGITLYGPNVEARGGIVSFNIEGVHPHDVAAFLDSFGVCIRGGHHCAMPLAKLYGVTGTARVSFYFYNTKHEIDVFVDALKQVKGFFSR